MKAKLHLEDGGNTLAAFDGQPTGYKVDRQGAMVTISITYPAGEASTGDQKRKNWRPDIARA